MSCVHYTGNQFCSLHNSKVASAYCGDICNVNDDRPNMNPVGVQCNADGINPCNCLKDNKCTRKHGVCWMKKGEGEYQ